MSTFQKLVEQYIPLANKLAYQAKRSLPRFVDIEDLKSAAYLGLVEAGSRYKKEFGTEFSTFAYPRIFGAIRDYLREQGWLKKGDLTPVLSLDLPCGNSENCTIQDTLEAKPKDETEECFEVITINLDDKAKQVLRSYFIDEYSMKEVGQKFGVSESRISQLIKHYQFRIKQEWSEEALRLELAA
jgi:RNA polymerase sigma factor (sigma-70 family)